MSTIVTYQTNKYIKNAILVNGFNHGKVKNNNECEMFAHALTVQKFSSMNLSTTIYFVADCSLQLEVCHLQYVTASRII